jgi:hypothetical protein
MLAGDANRFSNIYLGVEAYAPLSVGQLILSESIEGQFLIIDGSKQVLIFRL